MSQQAVFVLMQMCVVLGMVVIVCWHDWEDRKR